MFTPPGMGYDRTITVFSPDGRLFQVEYAMEAVKRGFTALGIRCAEGVILVAERRKIIPLIDYTSLEKIFKIDEHIGITYAGFPFDARILIDYARQEAQINRIIYDEPIDIEVLTKRISDVMQIFTQRGGVRPFGVAFLIAGVDYNGPRLLMTEPSGSYASYFARVIGSGSQQVTEFLEKHYKFEISLDEAMKLAISALKPIIEAPLEPDKLEIGIVSIKDGLFRKLSRNEIALLISSIKVV
ncbi:MAG: archaeal proteasome endopeptidase complex subunit alpha [Candidatus Methanomethylicia archaeon]|nr:archaeal proteasome endopeptidase complex subunit alpha [Candidatus Methanomethylicia archaeon]MCX8169041.1 archaeal proteasome endopeptidase complex subunit alpha [Candidatus Methanomethylicia archaeon]MDW7988773.1 archaeal proteasome endopeptidase complex subunit alpha [Nitrososphaerota archaeon]